MTAIEIRGLTKHFGPVKALDGIDLDVPSGAIFGFLGPNGAGKTTMLRLMTGLARPTAGTVRIDGIEVGSGQRPPIGYLPDTPMFYGWMNAREFLRYIADLHGMTDPPIDATLERVGLLDAAKKRVGGYSRGMKQRLGLAQALLPQPSVLLLDEPVSALDPAGRKAILDILNDLRDSLTVFFSTHILGDAERVCDEIGIIDHGHLVMQAPRDALLARYARPIFEVDVLPEAVPQLAGLAEQLGAQPWVTRTDLDGARLRLRVRDVDEARRELLPALTGLALLRVEMVGATLEDIFLSLTNGQDPAEKDI
ncbi:MAG TPA: ABC transporter ATP-binding protein [Aggregatilinea sp.]|jgi:ABC-2 type transport system ATP-binding protein|uniref:ABC transporter ATP-binding protein n=1 Tax=Aggregatilinea sp. TaxID=2806333 RepID=UPI002BB5FE92|nr:ABC transporter ATP-binding protein [Aggregatilinea sp.]HML21769.1 ABC transporter ATP-binding protein [Aggregatilinea sp.]